MADFMNDPSKSYHPLNNYNVNNPNGITHNESDDMFTQYLNDMTTLQMIVSFVIVLVLTLIIVYILKKYII